MLNPTLQRQILMNLGQKDIPEHFAGLFNAISKSYDRCEEERKMLRHFLNANSVEMVELNNRLNRESMELEKAHRELQTLFENIREVFFSVEMPGNRLLQMSSTCEQIYGYPVDDFERNSNLWLEVVLDQDRRLIEANFPLANAGVAFSQEYRIQHRNGDIRWLESRVTPTLDVNGQLVRIDGVTKDITEKKEAIEKLKKSQDHLLTSQRIANIGSWEIEFLKTGSPRKYIHFWTDETYRIFGYEPHEIEVVDDLFMNHVHPDDRAFVKAEIARAMQTRAICEVEHRIVTRDHREKTVHVRAEIKFHRVTGAPFRMVGTIRDVTEQKRREAERQVMTDNLVKQKQHLEQFAHIVSHDLRAPVANIIGFMDLAEEPEIDAVARNEVFSGLSVAARKLDDIIGDMDQVLHMTRGLAEKQEEVLFENIVEEVTSTVKEHIAREGVTLITDFSNAEGFVTIKSCMRSIFLNLITNSLKHRSSTTSPVIRIRSSRKNGKIKLIFNGNGASMDGKKNDNRAFELYGCRRGGIEEGGTELFMVRKQVESLNGTIHIVNDRMNSTGFVMEFNL